MIPCAGVGATAPELEDWKIGATTVLFGPQRGKYPDGNSLLVEGREETLIIDPSLGVLPRRDALPAVDRVVNSHCHEDHVAGNFLFPDASVHLHEADLPGIRSLDAMMEIFGLPPEFEAAWRRVVVERFHFEPRPDAQPYRDGDVFDLGGARVHAIHSPGHTRGHCVLYVEPDDVLFLGDIDLSSFGPYYGDAWSDLPDFERSLRRVREIEARYYATFHHVGVLRRPAFLERLDRFEAVIASRESRLLEFLREPRSLDEIAEHRFVFRPGDVVANASAVERRSMSQHLSRLLDAGQVRRHGRDTYQAV